MPLGLLYHRRCVGRPGEAVGDVYPQKSGKNAFFLNVCHVYVAGLAQRHQKGLFIVFFFFLEVLSVRQFTVHHSDSLLNTSLYDDTFALRPATMVSSVNLSLRVGETDRGLVVRRVDRRGFRTQPCLTTCGCIIK